MPPSNPNRNGVFNHRQPGSSSRRSNFSLSRAVHVISGAKQIRVGGEVQVSRGLLKVGQTMLGARATFAWQRGVPHQEAKPRFVPTRLAILELPDRGFDHRLVLSAGGQEPHSIRARGTSDRARFERFIHDRSANFRGIFFETRECLICREPMGEAPPYRALLQPGMGPYPTVFSQLLASGGHFIQSPRSMGRGSCTPSPVGDPALRLLFARPMSQFPSGQFVGPR
jgi:hypothetical protein